MAFSHFSPIQLHSTFQVPGFRKKHSGNALKTATEEPIVRKAANREILFINDFRPESRIRL